jgi:hypothetical protein
MRARSAVALVCGIAALIASLWLSGRGFASARLRSLTSLLLCAATLVGLWFV